MKKTTKKRFHNLIIINFVVTVWQFRFGEMRFGQVGFGAVWQLRFGVV